MELFDIGSGKKWSLRTLLPGLIAARREVRQLRRTAPLAEFSVFHMHFKREQIGFSGTLRRYGAVVWTEHGKFPTGVFGFLMRPMYRRASRHAEAIVCVSTMVKNDLEQRVRPRCQLVVIQSGVDLGHWNPVSDGERRQLRSSYGVPDDAKVSAVVGRLDTGKRPDLAIKSARAARTVVVVAGAGSMEGVLRDQFRDDKEVIFLGPVVDAREVYAIADVHVFASSGAGEGFPTVLLEAAAVGTVTVATDDCGFAQDVLDAGGDVAAPTLSALSARIEHVAAGVSYPSVSALEWVATRSIGRMADAYDQLFAEVIAKSER